MNLGKILIIGRLLVDHGTRTLYADSKNETTKLSMTNLKDARGSSRYLMSSLSSQDVRKENEAFLNRIMRCIKNHPFINNPAKLAMDSGTLDRQAVLEIHLDFKYAAIETFTDVILMAQFRTRDLASRFGMKGKMAARFLLTLNVLDEFGFVSPSKGHLGYAGNPLLSHPILFDDVLEQLDPGGVFERSNTPSTEANSLRQFFESTFDDLVLALAAILVTEEEAMRFSPPMRASAKSVGIAVDSGYYMVHGCSDDLTTYACDDYHQLDAWHILVCILEANDHERFEAACVKCCDLWDLFWNKQAARAP